MKLFVNTGRLLSQKTEDGVKQALGSIADYAVSISPVDTGAYVNSFSITEQGVFGGRSVSSDNLPTKQNRAIKTAEARASLQADIERLPILAKIADGDYRLSLKNNAPHARDVEDGENWQRDGYHVFVKIRSKFR